MIIIETIAKILTYVMAGVDVILVLAIPFAALLKK